MPRKKAAAAAAAPNLEMQLYIAIQKKDEDEAIRLIDAGADITKYMRSLPRLIHWVITYECWRVFTKIVYKGVKYICDDLVDLIVALKKVEPVNIEPIRAIFQRTPGFFLKCNQNRIPTASLWTYVFTGSKGFIEAFIDVVHEFDKSALANPAGFGNPILIGLITQNGNEEDIVAGLKHLYAKRGIRINTRSNDDPFRHLVMSMPPKLNMATFKRALALGYDINMSIYNFSGQGPATILLQALIHSKTPWLDYEDETEPVHMDPDTDVLSYLLENTPAFAQDPAKFFNIDYLYDGGLYEAQPNQLFLRMLYKLRDLGQLAAILASEPPHHIKIFIGKLALNCIRFNHVNTLNQLIALWPAIINAKLSTNAMRLSMDLYSYLINWAVFYKRIKLIRQLLAAGADPTLKASNGKDACAMAREGSNAEIIALVCRPEPVAENAGPKWEGFVQANVAKYNYIFDKERGDKPRAEAEDNSFCPICLTDVYRSVACNHMQHNCSKDQPERYHKELYNRFKDARGNVHWCTLCGRICIGYIVENGVVDDHAFIHYELCSVQDAVAGRARKFNPNNQHIQGEPYTHDCSLKVFDRGEKVGQPIPVEKQSGGGGLREKFLRIHRLRQYAYAIRGKNLSKKQAYRQLIEQVWNAPLAAQLMNRPELENIKGPESWNLPTASFRMENAAAAPPPPDPRPKPPAAHYADVKRSACDAERTLIVESGTNATSLNNITKDNKGCQFRHMEEDAERRPTGRMNRHEETPFLIMTVWSRIRSYVDAPMNSGGATFAKCLDDECKARIFPEDLEPLLDEKLYASKADFEQIRTLYDRYKQTFNWMFGGARLEEGVKPDGEPGPAVALLGVAAGAGGGAGVPAPRQRQLQMVIRNEADPRLANLLRNANAEERRQMLLQVRRPEGLEIYNMNKQLDVLRAPGAPGGAAGAAAAPAANFNLAGINAANLAAIQAALAENNQNGGVRWKRRTRKRRLLRRRKTRR